MTGRCFVDANVLVYARDPRAPVKQARAAEWIARLWRERRACTSVQVLSEFYVIATRKLEPRVSRELAWDDVRQYLAWPVQSIDEQVMEGAYRIEYRYRLSWWDSLVVSAAQALACETLLTEDLQDGMTFGSLRVRNPFLHAVTEPDAGYRVVPKPVALHRSRGRPRRTLAGAQS